MNMGKKSLIATVTGLAAAVCTIAGAQTSSSGSPDAPKSVQGVQGAVTHFSTNSLPAPLGGGGAAHDPGCPTCGPVSITHSIDDVTITALNSVSCNAGGLHTDNSYFRQFTLANFGIAGDFDVCGVQIGVEVATAGAGLGMVQPIVIRLYDTDDVLNANVGTLIVESITTVADQALSLECFPIVGTATSGGLVVEIFTPEGQTDGSSFFIGSNALGETDDSFLLAPACGVNVPTPTTAIGFPNMHVVLTVFGDEGEKKCPTDINGDEATDVLDLINLLLCFGQPAIPPCDQGTDLNQDGDTDVLDLIQLLLQFGQPCPPNNKLNIDCIQVGNDPVQLDCCIFDLVVENKGNVKRNEFYLDFETGTGLGTAACAAGALEFGPDWFVTLCFTNGGAAPSTRELYHVVDISAGGTGIQPGGILLGSLTTQVNGPAAVAVARAGEIPFTVLANSVHCHITDEPDPCSDPAGLGPHGDVLPVGGDGVPDHEWSGPGTWFCELPAPKGCQREDNNNAFASSCTPGTDPLLFALAQTVADDFNIDIDTIVDHVEWWGVYADFSVAPLVDCSASAPALQTFEIAYYLNDGPFGCPGTLLGSFFLNPTIQPTPRLVGDLNVFRYEVKHPQLTLLAGNCYSISIRNRIDLDCGGPLDPYCDCAWAWVTSDDGNQQSSVLVDDPVLGCTPHPIPWVCPDVTLADDFAFCLQGPTGPGGAQEPTKTADPSRCLPPPPNNDLCANRRPLADPGVAFSTIGASTDGPPADPAFCVTQGGGPFNDIWYNYTANVAGGGNGLLTVSTCVDLPPADASIDTVIAIYDGCVCDPVTGQPLGPQIACNDDDPVNPCGIAPTFQSTLSVPVLNGQCYKVQLGGFAPADTGVGFLSATCIEVTKDLCIGAVPIVLGPPAPQDIQVPNNTTVGATVDTTAPTCTDVVTGLAVAPVAPGVWYSVIGDGTTLTATTCDVRTILFDSALSVFCGPCDSLFCVGGLGGSHDDLSCPVWPDASTVQWCSAVGQEYLILVHGQLAADVGPFGLHLISNGVTCPVPDICSEPPPCDLTNCQIQDLANASTSNFTDFIVAEDFTPTTAGPQIINEICWWGTYATGTPSLDQFVITYYDSNPVGGLPLNIVGGPFSQDLLSLTVLGPVDTGLLIAAVVPEFEYKGLHADVTVQGGQCYWVEIHNLASGVQAWFWEFATGGDGLILQDGAPPDGYDISDLDGTHDVMFCLAIPFDTSACSVMPPDPPVNNLANARIPIFNGTTAFTTVAATTDGLATPDPDGLPGTMDGLGDCDDFAAGPQINQDVWYNYTAPVNGQLVVSTCETEGTGGSSTYDTKIAIYDGCGIPLPPTNATIIACNDDDAVNGCGANFHATAIAPIVVEGNCYKIRVGGFGAGSGTGVLSVHQ